MKRTIAALLLFIAVLTISVVQLYALKKATQRFTGLITEYEQSEKTDDIPKDYLDELFRSWEEYYDTVSFLTRSDALEDMSADMSRLGSVTDSAELKGELDSLRTRALLIYDEQVPHPRSVF